MSSRHSLLAPEMAKLADLVGYWITTGETAGEIPARVISSDTYSVVAGGRHLIHPFHGQIGVVSAGGLEIISYDEKTGHFITHLFSSDGSIASQSLKLVDDDWIWDGNGVRCKARFSEDKSNLVARHERLDPEKGWIPSMVVTLHRVS